MFLDLGSLVLRTVNQIQSLAQTLVGAGVGVELIFRGNFKARVDWARGIYQKTDIYAGATEQVERDNDIDPDGEFYFLLEAVW